jgi:hypothetical protein
MEEKINTAEQTFIVTNYRTNPSNLKLIINKGEEVSK